MAWTPGVRKAHRWLSIVIGIQLLLWAAGGVYFSWNPLPIVRGEAFLSPPEQPPLTGAPMAALPLLTEFGHAPAVGLRLVWRFDRWVWLAEDVDGLTVAVADASTGESLGPLDEAGASGIARAWVTEPGEVVGATWVEESVMGVATAGTGIWLAVLLLWPRNARRRKQAEETGSG